MKKCPTCKQKIDSEIVRNWLPFCSERCRIIDLGGWLSESHRIPAEPVNIEQIADDSEHTTH